MKCHCCGSEVDGLSPLSAALSAAERAIVEQLLLGKWVRNDALIAAIWTGPDGGPETAGGALNVFIHRANKKLAPLGYLIERSYGNYGIGLGFRRLVVATEEALRPYTKRRPNEDAA